MNPDQRQECEKLIDLKYLKRTLDRRFKLSRRDPDFARIMIARQASVDRAAYSFQQNKVDIRRIHNDTAKRCEVSLIDSGTLEQLPD